MTVPVEASEDAEKWYAALCAVVEQRRAVEAAHVALVTAISDARLAGAHVGEVAYAAGVSTRTLARWVTRSTPARHYVQGRAPAAVVALRAPA